MRLAVQQLGIHLQAPLHGYAFFAECHLLTIFSAPGYKGVTASDVNMGASLEINAEMRLTVRQVSPDRPDTPTDRLRLAESERAIPPEARQRYRTTEEAHEGKADRRRLIVHQCSLVGDILSRINHLSVLSSERAL